MSLRTTLLLFGLVAALLVVLFFARDRGGATEPELHPLLLPGLRPPDVTRVELHLYTGEMGVLELRDPAGWWMTMGSPPASDRADQERVRHLLGILSQNPGYLLDPDPDAESLRVLGLEPPRARITIVRGNDPSRPPLSVRFGERDPAGGWVNALVEGTGALVRTGADLANRLEMPLHQWLDPRLLAGDGALVTRFRLERPGQAAVVLERSGADWRMVEPIVFDADDAIAWKLVKGLFLLTVERFVDLAPQDEAFVRYGLREFATVATFDWGGGRTVEVRFGVTSPEHGMRYATDSVRRKIFAVQGLAMEELDAGVDELRDRQVCQVAQRKVTGAVLRRGGGEAFRLVYERTSRRFEIVAPFASPAPDDATTALYAWFRAISALQAEDFLDDEDLPEVGGDVDLFGPIAAAVELALLDPPRTITLEFGEEASGVVPVRRLDRPGTVFLVPAEQARRVTDADPRTFLPPEIFPDDLLQYRRVTVRVPGVDRERTIARDDVEEAAFWRDPERPESDTAAFQAFVAILPGVEAMRFLPRDPLPADRLDPPAAALEVVLASGDVLRVRFGARDPSGKTVVAACDDVFPERTVFELDARVLDELERLLGSD